MSNVEDFERLGCGRQRGISWYKMAWQRRRSGAGVFGHKKRQSTAPTRLYTLGTFALLSIVTRPASSRPKKPSNMHCPTTLLHLYLVALAATATYAAVDPLYATPGRVQQENYVEPDYTLCQGSTFGVIGDGKILISDCQAILDDLEGRSGFDLRLTLWQNSTALEDHFWTYVTSGSCQFALKRVDGLNTTVL